MSNQSLDHILSSFSSGRWRSVAKRFWAKPGAPRSFPGEQFSHSRKSATGLTMGSRVGSSRTIPSLMRQVGNRSDARFPCPAIRSGCLPLLVDLTCVLLGSPCNARSCETSAFARPHHTRQRSQPCPCLGWMNRCLYVSVLFAGWISVKRERENAAPFLVWWQAILMTGTFEEQAQQKEERLR